MEPLATVSVVTKCSPRRAGGGLGVAFNFFLGLDELRQPPCEVLALWGREVVRPHPTSWQAQLAPREGSPQESRKKTLLPQIRALRSANRQHFKKGGIIAFTPFYAWSAVSGQRPDIIRVHCEQSKGGRHHELAAERGRFGIRETIVRMAVGLNIRNADKLVFPSDGALELFKEANPAWRAFIDKNGKIIHNGVSLDPGEISEPLRATELKVVSVADHVKEKGLPILLQALAGAKQSGVNFTLQQFGNFGPMTTEIKQLTGELGLTSEVTFRGRCPHAHVIQCMRESDVFLHTPEVAIFDQCIVEAMLCGTLVVSANLPGIIEAVGEEHPCLAAEPEHIPGILKKIYHNRGEAIEVAKKSMLRAERCFSAATMTGNYLAVVLENE